MDDFTDVVSYCCVTKLLFMSQLGISSSQNAKKKNLRRILPPMWSRFILLGRCGHCLAGHGRDTGPGWLWVMCLWLDGRSGSGVLTLRC